MSRNQTAYYGPFFWLALGSFLVPLVVAVAAYQGIRHNPRYYSQPDESGVDQQMWDQLLKRHTRDGLIDYEAMANDSLFASYIRQLGKAQPESLASEQDQLAFYLNAYNALVIDGVISHRIRSSVFEESEIDVPFFDRVEHILAGKQVSLNEIENVLIRPRFQDPRVHAALVCAARGCPKLRREAYLGRQLDRQLAEQALRFANDPYHVAYENDAAELRLNSILSWYEEDWDEKGGILDWLEDNVEANELRQAIAGAKRGEVDIVFNDYDWSLNAMQELNWNAGAGARDAKSGGPSAEFGSGSIPNK